jgi:hypothetical protein
MAEGITATPEGGVYLLAVQDNGASGTPAINVITGVGTLPCVEQEDLIGDDEIRIRVEDQNLGKTVQMSGGDKLQTFLNPRRRQ